MTERTAPGAVVFSITADGTSAYATTDGSTVTVLSAQTAAQVADGLKSVTAPALGTKTLSLPQIPGFDVTIASSNDEALVATDGTWTAGNEAKDVTLRLTVTSKADPTDTATTGGSRSSCRRAQTPPSSRIRSGLPRTSAIMTARSSSRLSMARTPCSPIPMVADDLSAYTEKSGKAFADEFAKAQDTLKHPGSQGAIEAQVKAPKEAFDGLVRRVDAEAVNAAVKHAGSFLGGKYTSESLATLKQAIVRAKDVAADANASYDDGVAVQELYVTVGALVPAVAGALSPLAGALAVFKHRRDDGR